MNQTGALTQTAEDITSVTAEIRDLLIKKNAAYGDSALSPQRVFSKSDPMEQIRVRIDDKLNRIKHGTSVDPFSEDVELDLLGYLILHRIARKRLAKQIVGYGGGPITNP